jgi:hypothetical protein
MMIDLDTRDLDTDDRIRAMYDHDPHRTPTAELDEIYADAANALTPYVFYRSDCLLVRTIASDLDELRGVVRMREAAEIEARARRGAA